MAAGPIQASMNSLVNQIGGGLALAKGLQDRQKKAMQKVDEKKAAVQKQRRNFMDYLRNQPVSGGGTVGDLPFNVQRQIAATYSKSERRKLMDMEDKK